MNDYEPAQTVTHRFILCPHCNKGESQIDHLEPGRSAGPWYCDECGKSYSPRIETDGSVSVRKDGAVRVKTFDLLVLEPHPTPIAFLVEGSRFYGAPWCDDNRDNNHHKEFLYEEHSCPTNWLEPVKIVVDGDTDPHGFLKFVAFRDVSEFPTEEPCGPNAQDEAQERFITEEMRKRSAK